MALTLAGDSEDGSVICKLRMVRAGVPAEVSLDRAVAALRRLQKWEWEFATWVRKVGCR